MKILLVYLSGLPHRTDPYISLLPTGLCYLHACLREAGYDSLLANFSAWTPARIKKELLTGKPDVIGISQWTHNRHASLELARLCRSILPDSTIIMGGGHATFCYEDLLVQGSPVDVVVRGEGEATLLELVARLSSREEWRNIAGLAYRQGKEIIATSPRNSIENLDNLPLPARYLETSIGLDSELQAEFIVTTRGCPSACYFCSSPDFWGRKVRFRSPQAIVEEMLFIREKYGLIYFSIRDDTFTADRTRILVFCTLLQEQKADILWNCQSRVTAIDRELLTAMKRVGCECIQLGIESGSQRILQQLGKTISLDQIEGACELIREIGINLSIYLISDIPGETPDDTAQTLELLRHIHADDGYISPLAYYPGTRLYKDAVASGKTSKTIFNELEKDAIYATAAPGTSAARLLKEVTKNRHHDPGCFIQQKASLGYCYTTNVIAAEFYCQQGEYDNAEKELQEIAERQPDNPWGWFLLGDLYSDWGKIRKGKECYRKVLQRVPNHGPSKAALA
jgi:radical SAM superfamily enzyme YgiQ (UPF0313 family)